MIVVCVSLSNSLCGVQDSPGVRVRSWYATWFEPISGCMIPGRQLFGVTKSSNVKAVVAAAALLFCVLRVSCNAAPARQTKHRTVQV
jgi:hypothetical protein